MAKKVPKKSGKGAREPSSTAIGTPPSVYHKDGSICARGSMLDGKMHGHWEFFRKDGTSMRSGSFDRERQVGMWATYNAGGKPYKTTEMKSPASSGSVAAGGGDGKSAAKVAVKRVAAKGIKPRKTSPKLGSREAARRTCGSSRSKHSE